MKYTDNGEQSEIVIEGFDDLIEIRTEKNKFLLDRDDSFALIREIAEFFEFRVYEE